MSGLSTLTQVQRFVVINFVITKVKRSEASALRLPLVQRAHRYASLDCDETEGEQRIHLVPLVVVVCVIIDSLSGRRR
jgi:hypothetical protein